MTMGHRRMLLRAAAVLLLSAAAARATSTTPDAGLDADLAALKHAATTYPQPVRAGDLAHRYLIGPSEAQPVLGRIASPPLLRQPDGALLIAIDRGGILGFGTTRVTVPLDDVALMGEHVALVGLSAGMLADVTAGASGEALPADAVVKMGIVGPFH
jgi:hypothetical protein